MTKRILAMVLVLAMVLSLMPAVVWAEGTAEVVASPKAGTHTDTGHSDDCGVTEGWQAWPEDDSLPTSGKYYLTKDVTLTAEATLSGDLTLCLNGYVVTAKTGKRVISTPKNTSYTLTITDCTAYTEGDVYYAGALTGGVDKSDGGGGAIFVRRGGVLKLYDGRITDNQSQHDGTGGGAIMLQAISSGNVSKMYMYGGEISNNAAYKADGTTRRVGGGIYAGGGSTLEITGGTFTGNKATSGAAIYATGTNTQVLVSGATITGNNASTAGSGIYAQTSTQLTIEDTEITGNTGTSDNAEGYSAAVYMTGTTSKLTLSGKVVIDGNTTGLETVPQVVLNNATNGTMEKLYVQDLAAGSYVTFTVNDTKASAEEASDVVVGTPSTWSNGWIAFMDAEGNLKYVGYENDAFKFVDAHVHTLCSDTGCTDHTDRVVYEPWGDDPEEEGMLPTEGNWYLTKDVTVSAEVKLSKAETLNLCLNGKTVTGFSADGARAYSTTAKVATTINISDCQAKTEEGVYTAGKITGFTNTHTNSGGAGIYIREGSTLNFYDGIIEKCVSATGGGGIYIHTGSANIYGGLITNNKAISGTTLKHGGGVYLYKSNLTMYGGEISYNEANQGGGIYLYDSTATICGGKISDNTAAWGGGVAFKDGNNTLDMQGGQITDNTASSNGGGVQGAYGAAIIKISGDAIVTGNKLTNGTANNVRLGNSATLTVGQVGSEAKVGITVGTAPRAFSNAVSGDLSAQFPSDDTAYMTYLDADSKLALKENTTPTPPPADAHTHTLCNDEGCTEHTGEVEYQAWTDATSLPTEGYWYLDTDVEVSTEVKLETAITLNLCLNGHTVTGKKGSNIRAYSTTNNVESTIQISDCTGNGKFSGFHNTSTGSGGGVIFVRPGSTLKVFDVTFENNVSYCIGGAITTTGTTYVYDCVFTGNQAYKVTKDANDNDVTTWTNGGAIYVNVSGSTYGKLYVYGATFEDNKGLDGGAIYAASNTTTHVENAEFTGNEATDEGGVYRCSNGNGTFKNVKITGNSAKYGSVFCVFGGSIALEDVEVTGNHNTNGFGAFHMNRNNSGATPIEVTLKGKVIIDGNTAGASEAAQNLYMRKYEAYVDATGLTEGSKIGVTMEADRIANGFTNITTGQNGTDNSAYFASDDAAWVIGMDQEVYLKTAFEHIHCECGKTDCNDSSHKQVSYLAWNNADSLPSAGNYCLQTDVNITAEVKIESDLTLCLHGHKVTGSTGKGVRFISTSGENNEVLTIADCTAKTVDGVYTAGGFYNNTNTHTGSGGGAIFIRAGATLKFYDGIVSGNATATGGAAFYIKNATAYFYNGLIENNKATYADKWYNGGAMYLDSAKVTIYNTVITGNEANYGGAIHSAGSTTLDIRGGTITGNIAQGNGGAINAASASCDIKFSGEPVVTGNKLASGKANNVRLGGTGTMDVGTMGENASVGITANVFRAISTETGDYTKNFFSDDTKMEVIYQDKVLYMNASGNHKHCLCMGTAEKGCDHSQLTFVEWDDPTSMPTSGNYFLSVDVTVAKQATVSSELNLCLNGHTVKVGDQGGRVYYVTNNGKLNISDCAEKTGKLTGATQGAILTNAKGTGMEVNLYNGIFTGNHAGSTGGALVIQGECTFNMYGGAITGNSATSALKLDDKGQPTLDADGDQAYTSCNAGGLYVGKGTTFNMYGGEISGNKAVSVAYLKAGATKGTTVGGNGGGVYITGAKANLYGGKISGNEAHLGGGIFVSGTGAELNLKGTEVSGNTATHGGGIISQTKSTINLESSKVTGNTATGNGAGIYVSTATTLNMTGGEVTANKAAENGGGIYVLSSDANLSGGKISGNKADNGAGIYSSATTSGGQTLAATIYVNEGALITDNHATTNGGGIMMSGLSSMTAGEGSKIIMTGGEISKNTAKNAGGVLTQTKSAFELSGGKITGNSTSSSGGGVYISTGTSFTMTGGSITNNTTKGDGGGMYLLRSTAELKGGSISYNTAANAGGLKVGGAKVTISGVSVVGNKAVGKTTVNATTGETKISGGNAGGILIGRAGYKKNGVQYYDTPVVNIYSVYVADNTSYSSAAGILVQSKDTIFNMYGGTVTGNSTENGSGGGIYFSSNTINTVTGGTVSNNKAKNAGGMYFLNSTSNVSGMKVYGNEASNASGGFTVSGKTTVVNMKNVEIYDNTAAGSAGAMVIQSYAILNLEDSKIYGNSCEKTGGAIYFSNPGYGTLKNTAIYDNTAGTDAGAVYVGPSSEVTMDSVTVENNKATGYGGGLYNRGKLNLANSTIQNNTTDGNGGGIGTFKTNSILLQDTAGIYVENTTITGNTAGLQGGGVYLHRGCPGYLTNVTVTGNTAKAEGGGLYVDGDMSLESVSVTGNTSGGEGYAVYLTAAEYDGHTYYTGMKKLSGDVIINNNEGGDMFLGEGTTVAIPGAGLGEKASINVTLASGLLTDHVYGLYNYEGGNLVYTITAGDRSLTDPEIAPAEETVDPTQGTEGTEGTQATEPANDSTLLYAGVGAFAVVIAAIAVIVVLLNRKKKKAEETAAETTQE